MARDFTKQQPGDREASGNAGGLRNVGDDDRAASLLRPAIVRSKRQDGGQAACRTDGRQHSSDEQDLGRRRRSCD